MYGKFNKIIYCNLQKMLPSTWKFIAPKVRDNHTAEACLWIVNVKVFIADTQKKPVLFLKQNRYSKLHTYRH